MFNVENTIKKVDVFHNEKEWVIKLPSIPDNTRKRKIFIIRYK